MSVIMAGILLATVYMPLAPDPKNQVIMYLSETEVIHQNRAAGTRGRLYLIILRHMPGLR
jgi:hypothetical protein